MRGWTPLSPVKARTTPTSTPSNGGSTSYSRGTMPPRRSACRRSPPTSPNGSTSTGSSTTTPPACEPTPALAIRGIRKNYGTVRALRGADFTLMPGELHALLGENGAGKTTLMHIAYGLVRPEGGDIEID